jgi:cell division protein FtsN
MITRLSLIGTLCLATTLGAQEADLAIRPPTDSTIARARALALEGKPKDARKLIDSVMKSAANDDSLFAEALFWRGALATTAAAAEKDYRFLLVEAPLTTRAEDALLQLAQLEQARGDRKAASEHLNRYMLTYGPSPARPARPRVSLWLVKLLFEQNQTARGCQAVQMSGEAIPAQNVELRNQLEPYAQRCAFAEANVEPAGAPSAPGVAGTDSAAPRPKAKPATRGGSTTYSVQVAAYDSKEAATRMADLLSSRGLDARVDGKARPFRVRVGRFATRAEAVKLAQQLKSQGQTGFVTATP